MNLFIMQNGEIKSSKYNVYWRKQLFKYLWDEGRCKFSGLSGYVCKNKICNEAVNAAESVLLVKILIYFCPVEPAVWFKWNTPICGWESSVGKQLLVGLMGGHQPGTSELQEKCSQTGNALACWWSPFFTWGSSRPSQCVLAYRSVWLELEC